MTEKDQKYQIIKFDSFDFLIILMLKKNFYRQTDRKTDRPTDRPTDIWLYRSDLPSLKKPMSTFRGSVYRIMFCQCLYSV